MPSAMIDIERVSVSYDGGESLSVREVSLSVAAGSFVALVGASGSGKTSLLKTVNRLVEPIGGRVRIEGQDTAGMARPELRRRIGYVFQGVGLFPHMSVGENIGITADLLGWPREHIRARTDELINLVDLPRDYLARMPDMLSGGQRQRIGVARALCTGPKIVLMDEPFGALDPVTRDGLGTAYRALHQRLSLTTVMVTHDVQEAALLADRIIVLAAGTVIADGTPRNLLAGSNPGTDELFSLPRRQAERIRVMMAEPPRAT